MDKDILKALEDVRKLLILQLIKGPTQVSSEEIGVTLGVTGRSIRNIATSLKKSRKK